MSQPFVGEIKLVGFSFPPRGYVSCNGALLSISQNAAMFSLLGTTFGGNGVQTFGVPDFRGRIPVGQGQGPGLSTYVQGEMAGTENTTLLLNNMPIHNHAAATTVTPNSSGLTASTTIHALTSPTARVISPAGNFLTAATTSGSPSTPVTSYAAPGAGTDATMAPGVAVTTLGGSITASAATTVQNAGGSLPFSNLQPYLGTNYIIATVGIFPSRN